MRRFLVLAVAVLALTGCAATPPKAAAPVKTAAVSFTYGASASAVASAVKACASVKEETPAATAVGVSSLASCTIAGKQVDFYSWADAAAQGDPAHQFDGLGAEMFYAASAGWTAVAHADGDLSGQQNVAEAVAKSIGGKVTHVKP